MSAIEWTDVTWNPVRGCSRVSEGCRNCYAERIAVRFSHKGAPYEGFADVSRRHSQTGRATTGVRGHWTGRVELIPGKLDEPFHWRKPRRVFVNSMSDLFHEALPDEAIDRVFAVMALAPRHTFQVLTKRPDRMGTYLKARARSADFWKRAVPVGWTLEDFAGAKMIPFPLPNVWFGVSCEDQKTADERIPLLLQTPAAVRFVSLEPLLGPIDPNPIWLEKSMSCPVHGRVPVRFWTTQKTCGLCMDSRTDAGRATPLMRDVDDADWLDWVITGGESGPGARPCDVSWIRSIARQCREAGVPCFTKQWGARPMEDGKPIRLKSPKGGDPEEWGGGDWPREFPA